MFKRSFHGSLYFARRADTDGVCHIDTLYANAFHQARQVSHPFGGDIALVGTTHRTTHRATHCNARITRGFHDRCKTFDALSDRAVDIFLAEGFTGCAKHHHLIGLG